MASLEEAQHAKAQLKQWLKDNNHTAAVGIGFKDGGYAVAVRLQFERDPAWLKDIPDFGVPLDISYVGIGRAL